jgi:uncharacterized protein YdiU (UPF0061 family)
MQTKLTDMWSRKLGLEEFDSDLLQNLFKLMMMTHVDYTIFFRELSRLPDNASALIACFYTEPDEGIMTEWQAWLNEWLEKLPSSITEEEVTARMKQVNPKFTWREWLVVPAYKQAEQGEYSLIHELQQVFTEPYGEQGAEVEGKYYQCRPLALFDVGGVTHYSCSS